LTGEERTEVEGLARSTKTEHRLRQRVPIVLLAATGMPTRAIGRKDCRAQREGDNRGAERKYTQATDKRILAQLDKLGDVSLDPPQFPLEPTERLARLWHPLLGPSA